MVIRAPIGVLHETDSVDVDTAYMSIEVLPLQFQARESLAQGGLMTQTLYTLRCEYREDLRPSFVLVEQCCTQRTFQIQAIIPSDRRDRIEMTCVTSG